MSKTYDVIIVGGGFYGMRIAQFLREHLHVKQILVLEKEVDVMQRASYNNQARVHNGYHYPRSILTALRSRVNFPVFSSEYEQAIVRDFSNYYGVAQNFSKISARQFKRFFERIEAEIVSSIKAKKLFDPKMIEDVFLVKEYAFDSTILKRILLEKLASLDVSIHTSEKVRHFKKVQEKFVVTTDRSEYQSSMLINTTYSSINDLNIASNLPIVPLKHELTEMCLVTMPPELEESGFTVMCGPFFSLMPFPSRKMHTMSHVRYTPHNEWQDNKSADFYSPHDRFETTERCTNFVKMQADIIRYIPAAAKIDYSGESLWEVKTVLPQSEGDDSRPILYLEDYGGVKNYICIMGGKLDNIYDVFKELQETYAKAN
jgi:glycine/D-amino acid oxidase-like deaminating enzyme